MPHNLRAFLKQRLSFIRPLTPLMFFYLFSLAIFFLFRAALCLKYLDRMHEVRNYLFIFPIGFRIDTMLLCYLLTPLWLAQLFPARKTMVKIRWAFSLYCALLMAVFTFLEIATFPFMAEFDSRLDRIFLEQMIQVREVFGMIFKGYTISLILGLSAAGMIGWVAFRLFQPLFRACLDSSFKSKIIPSLLAGFLMLIGARSSVIHPPANISLAAFSTSHLANQLALNSTYSLAYAYYTLKHYEKDPRKIYAEMDAADMLTRVRRSACMPAGACTNPEIPLLHYQKSRFPVQQDFNLVIILEESLGSEYVGCLGGLPLTPNIDRLSKEGLLFTQLYATGTRTERGIEAVVSGFLPTPGTSTVKLGLSQTNFFTVAELLRRRGYFTEFIYGGRRTFDNMSTFFMGNGFQRIYDKKNFKKPKFFGTWGVSDEELLRTANELFKDHGDQPFFALILTTSNHDPFEFPDNRIELYEQPKATRNNAVKYADYSLGYFIDVAKKEAYYNKTIFLIIADHSTRLQGRDLIPINKFAIPGLVIGPNIKPGIFDKIASQIDMTPTVLDIMGISTEHPVPGRALLSLPDNVPGRAVMQYGSTNAFMENNRVVLLRPQLPPSQWIYADGRLASSETDPELVGDARAHALLPGYLYYHQLHHLPAEELPR